MIPKLRKMHKSAERLGWQSRIPAGVGRDGADPLCRRIHEAPSRGVPSADPSAHAGTHLSPGCAISKSVTRPKTAPIRPKRGRARAARARPNGPARQRRPRQGRRSAADAGGEGAAGVRVGRSPSADSDRRVCGGAARRVWNGRGRVAGPGMARQWGFCKAAVICISSWYGLYIKLV